MVMKWVVWVVGVGVLCAERGGRGLAGCQSFERGRGGDGHCIAGERALGAMAGALMLLLGV